MSATDSHSSAAHADAHERRVVGLLGLLAAVHVLVFSAAFPFFNNVDEDSHFDLAVKYAHGEVPRRLETVSAESARHIVLFGSLEYLSVPTNFPDGQFPPPPWTWPPAGEKFRKAIGDKENQWQSETNLETSQPPLYYALTGLGWRLEPWFGLAGGQRLYGLRFLNIFWVTALVWLGYATARLVFPERRFMRLGVPALLAFMPQTVFYSIQNDVLSPLCFGAVFLCLVKLSRGAIPGVRLGLATGLLLAATYLTKLSNLPLLAVAAVFLLINLRRWGRAGNWRAAGPALIGLLICAALPMALWLAWCKTSFGDLTGTAAKIHSLGWTAKPFSEWWHHPIFTPRGLWRFLSELVATFWRGETTWHRLPLAFPGVDLLYVISSAAFIGVALASLRPSSAGMTEAQRSALRLACGSLLAAVAFLGWLSIIYDFHNCVYPSRAQPYFISGRLMLGALIPFLLLYVYGLDRVLGRWNHHWIKPLALAAMIAFMLISEIAADWPVFTSQYNWFHL